MKVRTYPRQIKMAEEFIKMPLSKSIDDFLSNLDDKQKRMLKAGVTISIRAGGVIFQLKESPWMGALQGAYDLEVLIDPYFLENDVRRLDTIPYEEIREV